LVQTFFLQAYVLDLDQAEQNPPAAKLLKLIYISNNLLDLPQLLNLRKGDQTIIDGCKRRQPTMEVEYLSNH
jgi:hypothetical protein